MLSYNNQLRTQLYEYLDLGAIENQFCEQLYEQLYDQLCQLDDQLNAQLWDQLWDQVYCTQSKHQFRNALCDQLYDESLLK